MKHETADGRRIEFRPPLMPPGDHERWRVFCEMPGSDGLGPLYQGVVAGREGKWIAAQWGKVLPGSYGSMVEAARALVEETD